MNGVNLNRMADYRKFITVEFDVTYFSTGRTVITF